MKPISKTLFLKGMNCTKYIYLELYHPELKETTANNIAIENGKIVGLFGQELYKGGMDLTDNGKVLGKELILKTQKIINSLNYGTFYEAAFLSACKRYMCQTDALILSNKNNRVVEFKSSTRIKLPNHIYDIGWQWKVITESGFNKNLKYFLTYLNSEYIRKGEINIEHLFVQEDVTTRARDVQFIIDKHLREFEKALMKPNAPNVKVGKHCTSPYQCEFYKHCWKNVSETSIVNMSGIRKSKLAALERAGIEDIQEIPPDIELTEKVRIQIEAAVSRKARININGISRFIQAVNPNGPLVFMDFETTMPPIPLYDECSPYMQLPVQYCIIQRENAHSEYVTKEFIAKPNKDPRKDFIENLLSDLTPKGTILVYNDTFEKSRLRELAFLFPEYKDSIEAVIARIVDLSIPFKEKFYYSPLFNGRYSIKYVLPVLCPDMSYDTLQIRNGSMAMEQYNRLANAEPDEFNQIVRSLREYCYMDVLAMVRILESLQKIIK